MLESVPARARAKRDFYKGPLGAVVKEVASMAPARATGAAKWGYEKGQVTSAEFKRPPSAQRLVGRYTGRAANAARS